MHAYLYKDTGGGVMAKNLYDFGDEKFEEKKQEEDVKKNVEDRFDKYKTYSKSDLESEIEKEVKRQKANGTFNYAKLITNIDLMKTYLTKQQYDNIIALVGKFR